MGSPYIGEIRIFAGNFQPLGWAFCAGQLISISQNPALFQLLGTTYGGDGQQTFQLPDLRGRVPVHAGTSAGVTYVIGQVAGSESVTLLTQQIPQHNHTVAGSSSGNSPNTTGNTYGNGDKLFSTANPTVQMSPSTVANAGGSQPHNNLMPFVCINFIIALEGIFPTQN